MSKSFKWNSAEMWDILSEDIVEVRYADNGVSIKFSDGFVDFICWDLHTKKPMYTINITNIPSEPCTIHRPQKIKEGDVVYGEIGGSLIIGTVSLINYGTDSLFINADETDYSITQFTRGLPTHLFNEDGTRK